MFELQENVISLNADFPVKRSEGETQSFTVMTLIVTDFHAFVAFGYTKISLCMFMTKRKRIDLHRYACIINNYEHMVNQTVNKLNEVYANRREQSEKDRQRGR